jgi:hypothetical protein
MRQVRSLVSDSLNLDDVLLPLPVFYRRSEDSPLTAYPPEEIFLRMKH